MESQQESRPPKADKRLSRTWVPFASTLATVLGRLEEDQYLIILAKRTKRYVQFAGQGSFGMRAEATSNHYLQASEKLGRKQVAAMKSVGWFAPTGRPKSVTPEKDPDGSPNFFVDFEFPVPFVAVSQLAVTTLAEIFELPYPGALEYQAFDADGEVIQIPELGLRQAKDRTQKGNLSLLQPQLLSTLRAETGIPDLQPDADGDITVQYGAISISVVILGDPPWIRIFAAIVPEAKESPELLAKLNSINDGVHRLHCFLHGESVYAVTDVSANPLVESHLITAMRSFSETAESLAILLQAEFSGIAPQSWGGASALRH